MGAVRRKFTKEFKEEAVRRLGLGASLAEVATGLRGESQCSAPVAAGAG